jgi:hypothetical protein
MTGGEGLGMTWRALRSFDKLRMSGGIKLKVKGQRLKVQIKK